MGPIVFHDSPTLPSELGFKRESGHHFHNNLRDGRRGSQYLQIDGHSLTRSCSRLEPTNTSSWGRWRRTPNRKGQSYRTSRKRPWSSATSCTNRSENTRWHSCAHSRIAASFVSTVLGDACKRMTRRRRGHGLFGAPLTVPELRAPAVSWLNARVGWPSEGGFSFFHGGIEVLRFYLWSKFWPTG